MNAAGMQVEAPRWMDASFRMRSGQALVIRHCRGLGELEACVDLQRLVWGYPDLEVTPRKAFLLAQELGGQVIGAFDEDARLAGFAMAMAALETAAAVPTGVYLHSHMLAVRPEFRNMGLGVRLKLAQREDAIARGIGRLTWTFDPLEVKNAYLNLHKLGAIAQRYSPDFYGVSASRLQGGLPTDRLHADWWLQSARVVARVSAMHSLSSRPVAGANVAGSFPAGATPVPRETISVPSSVDVWKQSDLYRAELADLQLTNRSLFLAAFARGLVVTGFRKDADGSGLFELTDWDLELTELKGTAYED